MRASGQFKKGALEMCVLYLVQTEDRYGYELRESVNEYIQITEGALYPVLRRLVKDGCCLTYTKQSAEGPSRKYYQITEVGKAYLGELIAEWDDFVLSVNRLRKEN